MPAKKRKTRPNTASRKRSNKPARSRSGRTTASSRSRQASGKRSGGRSKAKTKKKATTKSARRTRAKTKGKARSAARSKTKAKSRTKSKTKSKSKSKATTKRKTKSKTKTKSRSKAKPAAGGASAAKKKASTKKSSKTKRQAPESVADQQRNRQPLPIPRQALRNKVLPRKFLVDLAETIREAVEPSIESLKGREVVGSTPSGDATFELDKMAEKALLGFLRRSKLPVAYYSEDSGYTTFATGQPTNLLIVDPIDGTRAARCGFESCVVSVCSTRVIERPRFGHVDNGCVLELRGKRTFYAERGKGARMYVDGKNKKIKLSQNDDLEAFSWCMTVPARPAELIYQAAAKLIDLTSLKGGFFACNSTSYSLTRLISNQLDACVDIANRFYRDIPEIVADRFVNAGRGNVLGMCPYDFAAALLIAEEAGCSVTDAYGKHFDDVLLLDNSDANQRSLIAASNASLHQMLLSFFSTRIQQIERVLQRTWSGNGS